MRGEEYAAERLRVQVSKAYTRRLKVYGLWREGRAERDERLSRRFDADYAPFKVAVIYASSLEDPFDALDASVVDPLELEERLESIVDFDL